MTPGHPGILDPHVALASSAEHQTGWDHRVLGAVDGQVRGGVPLGIPGGDVRRPPVDAGFDLAADPELAGAQVVVLLESDLNRAGEGEPL
jgi:hypothetical protein